MPTFIATAPDGTKYRVTAPEGATQADIQARVAQQHGGADNRPTSFWQGLAEGMTPYAANAQRIMDYVNPVNMLGRAAVNAVAPRVNGGPLMASPTQQVQRQKDASARSQYRGSTAGRIVGGVVGSLPTLALPGGAAIQGAAAGAMGTEDPTDVKQLAVNAGVGAVAGKAGDIAGKTLGRIVAGNTNPAVRALAQEGVTLTPGMRGGPGSTANFLEDKVMGSVWPLSGMVDAAQKRSFNDLRRAVANRVLEPIGESVPKGTPINHDAIAGIQQTVHDAYDNSLHNMQLDLTPELVNELGSIHQGSVAVAGPDGAQQIEANIQKLAGELASGPVSGQRLRELVSGLRGTASRNAGTGVGDQLWSVHDAISNALEQQNGGQALTDYIKARSSESLLRRLEDAASRAGTNMDGEFGPTQLKQAVSKRGYGTTVARLARGDAPMQDLANAAAGVMRNKSANSGTVPRAMALGAIADPLAALAMYKNPVTALPFAAAIPGYIPGLDSVIQNLALRPQVFQQAGTAIQGAAPYLGGGTAAAAAGLLSGY